MAATIQNEWITEEIKVILSLTNKSKFFRN